VETVLDVIKGGKWNKALFTTYALSLSFFESILLRALRQIGCQEVWIISDLQGYKASLIERRSNAIGHDYRLIPVRLRKGIFHPKCLYFAGPDEDAIAVGSGNLTFGGFGRNLEVLEVFSSRQTPELFRDFADFLASIRTRDDFECPDLTWCKTFEDRARGVGLRDNRAIDIHLLHSATMPIIDQLTQALHDVDELTVLSPFYDEDGYAVRTTTERLSCNKLRIAVPPSTAEFNFPFQVAQKWGIGTQSVWADTLDSKRSIHAKWFEFRGKHTSSVMTGSANATKQALCTTNNIEVSVLRTGSSNESWANWEQSQLPRSFVPTTYSSPGTPELLAHATLTGDVLEGMILGLSAEAGWWKGTLTKPNGDTKEFTAYLNDDARFQVADLTFSNFAFSSGVQILLSSGGRSARGWVHAEDVLRMTRLPNFNLGALLRIIARENTEDDDVALLEYLAINAQKHLPSFVGRIKSLKESKENDHTLPVITVDLEELAPTDTPSAVSSGGIDLAELSLERVFAQLRKRLLGHGPKYGLQVATQAVSELESDSTDPEEAAAETDSKNDRWTQPPERMESALHEFDREMRDFADSPELAASDCRGLLVLWFEVMMCMLLMRKGDIAGAYIFLNEWVNRAARRVKVKADLDSLEQHFVTSVAMLATKNSAGHTELHELLELYFAGEVEESRLAEALLPPTGIPFGALHVAQGDSLQDTLHRVLQSTTLHQELVAVIDATKRGEAINDQSPLFKGEAGDIILAELKNFSGSDRFKEQLGDELVCAKCYEKLPKVMASSLEYCRIAFHKGWFTVRTKR
jgi:HKD family nuclease